MRPATGGGDRSQGTVASVAFVCCALFAVAVSPLPAAEWIHVETPHFEIYTDGGGRLGRRAAETLEQVRQAFSGVESRVHEAPLPLKVFLFRSSSRFNVYRPSPGARGFFHGAADADYILVDASASDRRRILVHEYVHVVLGHTSVRLPQWLEEGLAEFYSTITLDEDRVIAGRLIPNHIRALQQEEWLDASVLQAVDSHSPLRAEDRRAGIFYAQSWALIHMLLTAPPYRNKVPDWFRLLTAGLPPEEAFRGAFGRDLAEALAALRLYVQRGTWRTVEHAWEPPPPVNIVVETMDEERMRLVLLDLELALGVWDVTEKELARLAQRRPDSPRVETARALLALSRKQHDAAKAHFERAIRLGARDARTWLEYAMLLKEEGAPAEEVEHYLEEAVERNPRYAEAWFLLGLQATARGQYSDAARAFEQAVRVSPRQSHYWHALALAYHQAGRSADARKAARRALHAAQTPEQRNMAEAAIRLVGQPSDWIPPGARPEVETPRSWYNRRGDRVVQGRLTRLDCLGERARLVVRTDAGLLPLLVQDPGKVVLRNAGAASFEFACGPLDRSVRIEYVKQQDAETGTQGVVTAIEFPPERDVP